MVEQVREGHEGCEPAERKAAFEPIEDRPFRIRADRQQKKSRVERCKRAAQAVAGNRWQMSFKIQLDGSLLERPRLSSYSALALRNRVVNVLAQ